MADLARVRVTWTGAPVIGDGVSTFYFLAEASGFVAALTQWFTDLNSAVASGVTFAVPNTGDLIDVATGELSGTWTGGTALSPASGNLNDYAAGVGMRVRWGTSGIRNGRRVRGSTFIVPIGVNFYDSDGSLDNSLRSTQQGYLDTFFAAVEGDLVIYSRPQEGNPGQANPVISASLVDKVSWLRSRRT